MCMVLLLIFRLRREFYEEWSDCLRISFFCLYTQNNDSFHVRVRVQNWWDFLLGILRIFDTYCLRTTRIIADLLGIGIRVFLCTLGWRICYVKG